MNSDRVVIITGASRGIGACTAKKFARSGYRVVLVARSQDALDDLAKDISDNGGDALVIAGDLSDLSFCKEVVTKSVEHFGRVDVLINNAAWREVVSMQRITEESWDRTLRVCLTAPAFLARWAAEDMQRRRQGVILNVSSIMSEQTAGICAAYVVCKGGLDSLTYELASLYGQYGIRVVGIRPGAIDTELGHDLTDAEGTTAMKDISQDMIALWRWAKPEEIANVMFFLASDDASYINGTNVLADGGWQHQTYPLSFRCEHFSKDFG